jgi:MFS family permease
MVLRTHSQPAQARQALQPAEATGRSWLMLAVLLLGQFMCLLDVFVVNVAMPAIGTGLHASGASLQLVVGGYTIAYAMLLITGARLGDRFGRRRMYLAGVIIFTAASLACALAPDSQILIAFRFVQGAGAAVLIPQVFSIIQLTFSGQARAKALSAYAAVISAGAVAGLVLGGVVVTANLFGASWRPVFAINVPVGIVLAVLVPRLVPAGAPPAAHRPRRLDLGGLMIAVPAVLLIVLPLVLGREVGWPAWCFGAIAAGAALAVVFVLAERRVAARGADPLLNLDVLRAPVLPAGLAALACSQVAYGGLLFAFTLHLQAGLGQSALRAGLSYLPMSAAFGLVGLYWRRLPAATWRVIVPAGLAVTVVAYLSLAVGVRGGTGVLVWAGLVAMGLGLGLAASPLFTQVLAHVPAARASDASGLLTTTVQLGQLLGVAIVGSVYLSRATAHPGVTSRALASAGAMSTAACWLAALSVAGLLAALVMVRAARKASG